MTGPSVPLLLRPPVRSLTPRPGGVRSHRFCVMLEVGLARWILIDSVKISRPRHRLLMPGPGHPLRGRATWPTPTGLRPSWSASPAECRLGSLDQL